jgi:hypothetical protein
MPLDANIQAYINNAASQYGVDANLMGVIAQIESGGNPNATNPYSSAEGLFQFTSGTAAQYGLANPFDPQQSSNAAAQLIKDNYNALSSALGTAPSNWQQYLAYQQGVGGAIALLTADPNSSAVQALINAGMSPTIANQSIINNVGSNFQGDKQNMSVADFLGYWQSNYNSKATGSSAGAYNSQGVAGATPSSVLDSLFGNETQAQRDQYNSGKDATQSATSWAYSVGSRIAIFVIGAIMILGALFLFRDNAPQLIKEVKPS